MKRAPLIVLLLASCLAEEVPVPDGGADPQSDAMMNDVSSIFGERVVEFDTPASTASIRNFGEFLLFDVNDDYFWAEKTNFTPVRYFGWPDNSFPGAAGERTPQFGFDTSFSYLAGAVSETQSAVVIIEHSLGNPNGFFGQPVVILDIGPGTDFQGVAAVGRSIVATMNGRNGVSSPHVVVVSEASPFEPIDTARIVDPRIAVSDQAAFFVTEEGVQAIEINTRAVTTAIPGASSVRVSDGMIWAVMNGELFQTLGICFSNCTFDGEGAQVPTNVWDVDGRTVVVGDENSVTILDVGTVETAGDVLAITTDQTYVYWISADGLYRGLISDAI